MARAGYDPVAMASFFELLREQQGRDPGKLEQFFSNHPASADREARIRLQARSLGTVRSREVGGFERMRAGLLRLAPASSRQTQRSVEEPQNEDRRATPGQSTCAWIRRPLASRGSSSATVSSPSSTPQTGGPTRPRADTRCPSHRRGVWWTRATGRPCSTVSSSTITHPSRARATAAVTARSTTTHPSRTRTPGAGAWRTPPTTSSDRSSDRTRTCAPRTCAARPERIDGASALSVALSGRSPVTGQEERVTVYTRSLSDHHVIYALSVVPGRDSDALARTFANMLRTLNVNDEAAHRSAQAGPGADVRSTSRPRR